MKREEAGDGGLSRCQRSLITLKRALGMKVNEILQRYLNMELLKKRQRSCSTRRFRNLSTPTVTVLVSN
ncbi:hypothetical protein KAX17_18115, partial [Candidatus Bipolaricaulota bacterium]|nr:hypothetical protein [Candidatus Bipolaricaulota bacterium]